MAPVGGEWQGLLAAAPGSASHVRCEKAAPCLSWCPRWGRSLQSPGRQVLTPGFWSCTGSGTPTKRHEETHALIFIPEHLLGILSARARSPWETHRQAVY